LKPDAERRLGHLFRRRLPPRNWITPALVEELCRLAADLHRMIGVVLDRRGRVREVAVGDAVSVALPPLPEPPGTRARLNGLRFFWTAPDNRRLGEHDRAVLRRHRLDALGIISFGRESTWRRVERAYLVPPNLEGEEWVLLEPRRPEQLPEDFLEHVNALEAEFRQRAPVGYDTDAGERVLIVGTGRGEALAHLEEDLAELRSLVHTVGGRVVAEVTQKRDARDPRTLVRAGKVDEINTRALQAGADLVVFLEELTASQANKLVDATGLKIIDRTQLILDIFALRAKTAEGKIQVELARLRYLLPRLVGKGQSLSRLGGGIGSNRGVGEKRLELDRRRIQERIERLQARLDVLRRGRELRRLQRQRSHVPVLALVGYTNAGKTAWLNRLTGAGTLVENRLFSTLETTARRVRLPSHRYVVITDTVGFIRDLPADLKATFHATLEELGDATLLVHVADASHDDVFARVDAVEDLLGELGLLDLPRIRLFNKADLVDTDAFRPMIAGEAPALLVSVRHGDDVKTVRRAFDDRLDVIPGVISRPVPRHLEAEESIPDAEIRAAPGALIDYVDLLDEAPAVPPRPVEESSEQRWGFFEEI
jgi:GTPase